MSYAPPGGRTSLALDAGVLVWDPDQLAFVGVFAGMDCPTEITIRNPEGVAWVVPVTSNL